MFKINNKNLISLGLGLLTIFAFAIVLIPKNAKANVCNTWLEGDTYYSSCNNNYSNNNNTNPIPAIYSISPNSARINAGAISMIVSGNNFVSGSVVRLNDTDRPTTFINSRTLRAQLDYYDLKFLGSYQITVFNPTPGGGSSNPVSFVVKNNIVSNTSTSTTSRNQTNNSTNSTDNTNSTQTTNTTNNNTSDSNVKDLAGNAIFGTNAFMPSSLFQWFFFAILILLAVILWRKLYVKDSDRATPLKHA